MLLSRANLALEKGDFDLAYNLAVQSKASLDGFIAEANSVKDKVQAANQVEGLLSRLLVLRETYPQLKANENFLKLQDSLEGTENRIAVERMRYNEQVKALNTYRRTVFGRFFASLAGVNEAQYYEVPQAEKEAPKVKF